MALSPDGHYLAHTQHVGPELMINILDLETLTRKTRLIADEDRLIGPAKIPQRASLRFLEWATPTRLVFAPPISSLPPFLFSKRHNLKGATEACFRLQKR